MVGGLGKETMPLAAEYADNGMGKCVMSVTLTLWCTQRYVEWAGHHSRQICKEYPTGRHKTDMKVRFIVEATIVACKMDVIPHLKLKIARYKSLEDTQGEKQWFLLRLY